MDVTSYEVLKGKGLKELFPPSGGDWGGNRVNEEFLSLLGDLFGTDALKEFRQSNSSEYHELEKSIEISKGMLKDDDDDTDFTLKIPGALWNMDRHRSKNNNKSNEITREGETYRIEQRTDKIRFSTKLAKACFKQPIYCILQHLRSLLNCSTGKGIELIIMAGGFSNSMILLDAGSR